MRISVLRSGSDASGLSRYLFGEGRHNEHTNQRLVAGSPGLEMEFGGQLSLADATILGRVTEGAWRENYVEQLALVGASSGGISRAELHREGVAATGREHVFHASMALPSGHRPLTDEQWNTLAHEYVRRMGFVDENGHGSAWYAVNHGQSAKGNDHIHIVVNLVRQDGSWSSVHQSKNNADRIGRELESEFSDFLEPTYEKPGIEGTRAPGFSAYTQAEARRGEERELDAGTGPVDPDRVHLQRVLRGAAMGSKTEAEWLTHAANAGLELRPRWEKGGKDKVTGYSVRLADVEDSLHIAASKLAPDLTLRSLRKLWEMNETPESRAQSLGMWREEEPVPAPQVEADAGQEFAAATEELRQWQGDVESTDPEDVQQWRGHAAHAAGMLSWMAVNHPDRIAGSQLGRAADEFARISFDVRGDTDRYAYTQHGITRPTSTSAVRAAHHVNLALRASGKDSGRGWLAVMTQLGRTARAISDAQQARGELINASRSLALTIAEHAPTSEQLTAAAAPAQSTLTAAAPTSEQTVPVATRRGSMRRTHRHSYGPQRDTGREL